VAVEVNSILKKILKSNKGISPILATLLLIVIAVAAVIVTYAWVMTFTTSQTQQAGAILSVENIYFNSTGTETIAITIRNSGSADAKIADVYAGTSATAVVKQTLVTYDPTTQIVTANGGSITMTITYDWTTGTKVYFKVATEAGQTIPFDKTP
jgi:flagellin-like protein